MNNVTKETISLITQDQIGDNSGYKKNGADQATIVTGYEENRSTCNKGRLFFNSSNLTAVNELDLGLAPSSLVDSNLSPAISLNNCNILPAIALNNCNIAPAIVLNNCNILPAISSNNCNISPIISLNDYDIPPAISSCKSDIHNTVSLSNKCILPVSLSNNCSISPIQLNNYNALPAFSLNNSNFLPSVSLYNSNIFPPISSNSSSIVSVSLNNNISLNNRTISPTYVLNSCNNISSILSFTNTTPHFSPAVSCEKEPSNLFNSAGKSKKSRPHHDSLVTSNCFIQLENNSLKSQPIKMQDLKLKKQATRKKRKSPSSAKITIRKTLRDKPIINIAKINKYSLKKLHKENSSSIFNQNSRQCARPASVFQFNRSVHQSITSAPQPITFAQQPMSLASQSIIPVNQSVDFALQPISSGHLTMNSALQYPAHQSAELMLQSINPAYQPLDMKPRTIISVNQSDILVLQPINEVRQSVVPISHQSINPGPPFVNPVHQSADSIIQPINPGPPFVNPVHQSADSIIQLEPTSSVHQPLYSLLPLQSVSSANQSMSQMYQFTSTAHQILNLPSQTTEIISSASQPVKLMLQSVSSTHNSMDTIPQWQPINQSIGLLPFSAKSSERQSMELVSQSFSTARLSLGLDIKPLSAGSLPQSFDSHPQLAVPESLGLCCCSSSKSLSSIEELQKFLIRILQNKSELSQESSVSLTLNELCARKLGCILEELDRSTATASEKDETNRDKTIKENKGTSTDDLNTNFGCSHSAMCYCHYFPPQLVYHMPVNFITFPPEYH